MVDCGAAGGHNYAASVTAERNGYYSVRRVLYGIKGIVACSFCEDRQHVSNLTQVERAPVVEQLARLHVRQLVSGRGALVPRPMSEALALWAISSYGVDQAGLLPDGLNARFSSMGAWEHAAPGDIWLTVATLGARDAQAGRIWMVTAEQLSRIPLDPRLE
jgi:hypothetical protein